MVELKNDLLSILVSERGAELQSIKDASGKEYLWQADPNFWPRHSPILFPIVCSVNNDTYRVDGKEYHLPRHGFARDTDFKLIAQSDRKVTFALESDEETKKVYPYDFTLSISYVLDENKVGVIWHVLNTDNRLVKEVLEQSEAATAEALKPIEAELRGLNARKAVLQAEQDKKKYDEITEAERKDMEQCRADIEAEEAKKREVIGEYAKGNERVHQLIDLALLQNGLLTGEALTRFVKRSVELL